MMMTKRPPATPAPTPLRLPDTLAVAGERIEVGRAWFDRLDGDVRRLTFEGRDGAGRLRAGWLDVDAAGRPADIDLLAPGVDPRLTALAGLAASGDLLVHRAGRRGVVRVAEGFAKVLRVRSAPEAGARARRFAELAAPRDLTVPAVLAEGHGVLLLSYVPGVSLQRLGGADAATFRSAWRAWASAWPRWAGTPASLPDYHGVEDELRTLASWIDRVTQARPAGLDLARIRSRFDAVAAGLQAADRGVAAPCHRDLHDKQVLIAGDRVGLIDSDTLALADPALDLGNLLAHVDLRRRQGLLSAGRARWASEIIRDVADGLRVPPPVLDAWVAATQLRLRCVYAFRPRWAHLVASADSGGRGAEGQLWAVAG